uniref:THAP-type domain-containing protein n=1 Tax=Lepisosteus oculatus TaxID=7918 RepID=W5MBH1_LEPOC
MPDICAAANCNQCTDQSNIAFFRFPRDPVRCKQWLDKCRRPDLEQKTPEQLHKLYKLCARHFEPSLICKNSTLRTVLQQDAVPTIFDFTSHLNNPNSHNRKRIREINEEESSDSKKAKDGEPCPALEPKDVLGESSAACGLDRDACEEEDPSISKTKETLKLYFKETLAFTGFSIRASAAAGEPPESRAGLARPSCACAGKIDPREVLQVGEDCMRDEIRGSLRSARFFSVLLEDVASIEGRDQIPVFVRSVTVAGFPQKHLMGFLPCDGEAETLAYMLLSAVRNKWGLRMEHCRGLTYLTSGRISQKMKDVASRILQEYPQVVLTPSDPYAFNVWLIRCMPIASIQRVVNTVEEVAAVLRSSAALQEKLEEEFVAVYGHIKGEVERIREAYQTRWEYGADAFQTMLDILEPFIRCMSEVRADPATAERVGKLKPVLTDFNFIIALVVLKNTLCCVSILNPSLKGTISISSTLQFIISNALKLLSKQLQEIAIFHRKWFSDACNRARKLGVEVTLPENLDNSEEGAGRKVQTSPEDFYRATLSTQVLQYLIQEVKQVFSSEMVRILRWLTLVPSYMADHNFSIRRDKVADANLNNLARPDSFYDELGCWEVKWKHASKRRILPTTVFGTLKIPDIGFYPNVQSLLKVLGTIPCVNVEADVYGQYDMVLERFHSYLKVTPPDERLSNVAFVFVNQDVHFSVEDMVDAYVEKHPDILQLLRKEEDLTEPHLKVPEDGEECVSKEEVEESQIMTGDVKGGSPHQSESPEKDQETLKSTLKAVVKMVCGSHIEDALGVCRGSEKGGGLDHMCTPEMKEMLAVCEDAVRAGILAEIGNSFFSLFIDRVVTLGQKDYLPLFLRFVDNFDNMRLELMGFVEADLDADSLSEQLYSTVTEKWHLDLKYCRGQAYLGSGKVAGKLKAFADKIREKYPLAICTHCSCYSFNVWWSKSIPVPAVCRAMDTVEEVILFFSSSPMLEKQLDHVIALGLRESYEKVQELQGIFCAQWLEKHDTYEVLVQMLEPLVDCLEKIRANRQQKWSAAVSEQAGKLLGSIKDFDFIISMVALKNASSFTRELSAGLQKDHFTAATQLCQISGILSTLNRVKTTIKVFHQSWFDEACALALNLAIQIKVPESSGVSRDTMTKPVAYYKEALSAPLVDNLIQAIKDHFSDEHKEALNFLSLVPCSMTVSYMFEILKAKAPLYVSDLPDPGNFFTELCCWRVKWKTRVASVKIPDTIFHTLRLPDMKYFGNVNTLLRIMCVLPSTTMEYCGEARHHKQFQEYLRTAVAGERSSCLAVLQVGCNLTRDLDRMVERCMTVASKAVEVLCVDKGLKHLVTNTENTELGMEGKVQSPKDCIPKLFIENLAKRSPERNLGTLWFIVEHHEEKVEKPIEAGQDEPLKVLTENGHPGDDRQGLEAIFRTAAQLARRNCQVSDLPSGEQQDLLLDLKNTCHWAPTGEQHSLDISMDEILTLLVRSIRQEVLFEIQKSPFFSLIVDRVATIAGKKYLPTFVKYLFDCSPKVELIGFLPYDDKSDGDALAENFHATLTEDWGLQMKYCRGQAYMRLGAESLGIKKASLNFLGRYPLAINTPCSSSGVVFWLAGCLPCPSVSRGLETVEQLLLFFDQSHKLPEEVVQVAGELLDSPKELVAEEPRTSCLNLVKREDIFDILVDRFEGLLKCLDTVSSNTSGSWSDRLALQASLLSGVMRDTDFVVTLVLLKRAFSLSRSFCHVFQCGNSASIVSEMDKAGATIDFLKNALANIDVVHPAWFEEALQLANKVNGGRVSFPQDSCSFESPERYYKQTLSIPILSSLMEEIRHAFSDSHLKTLKYLALVPSCNPGTSVPECLEKMPIIHQIDLPEPDTVQEDLSNWGSFWKEKSGVSLPASVYDTLLHPESECSSNVFTLLKVLAVLPSIRPQSSITEDGLTSLRACLRSAVNRSSKPDLLILQVHQRAVGNLDDVIDKYIEADPERRALLSKVKVNLDHLK